VRLGRSKNSQSGAVVLPEVHDVLSLNLGGAAGGRIPARVLEKGEDTLLIAITVPTRPLTAEQMADMIIEYTGSRGRVRLRGTCSMEDPNDSDLVRVNQPRSVEVLQEREYVRIRSARPVLVYSAREQEQVQSYTVDVSGGGLLLAGPDTLRVGEEVKFRLTLTPGVLPVSGTGHVVRTDNHGRLGLVFDEISDLDRRRLVRFIFECQRAERRRGLDKGDDGA
jgi:hypothetical protein